MLKVVEAGIAAGIVFHCCGAALGKALSQKVCNQLQGTVTNSESLDHSDRYTRAEGPPGTEVPSHVVPCK